MQGSQSMEADEEEKEEHKKPIGDVSDDDEDNDDDETPLKAVPQVCIFFTVYKMTRIIDTLKFLARYHIR